MNDQVLDETKVQEMIRYLKILLIIVVILGIGTGAYFFFKQQSEKKGEEAFAALFQAEKLEDAAAKEAEALGVQPVQVMMSWPEARKKEYEDKLTKIGDDYKGTAAASSAMLRAARWKFLQKKNGEARDLYQKIIKTEHSSNQVLFRAMAFEGLAVTFEEEKNFAEAEKTYKEALDLKDNPLKPLALLGTARVKKGLGKKEEVKGAYEALIKEYPNTPYERKARALMALEG